MEIRALQPGLAGDFFGFFDDRAFVDNPDWKNCYCTFFHRPPSISPEEAKLRPSRRKQAEDLIASGLMRGYLAYEEGKVVGWCNVNAKTSYQRLEARGPGDDGLAAVVCFVVEPGRRRQGIARALLAHAVEESRRLGYRAIEAYPSARARSAGGHYHGPLSLYESLGFRRLPGPRLVVSLDLQGA